MVVIWYFLLNFIQFILLALNLLVSKLLNFDFVILKFKSYYLNFYNQILDTKKNNSKNIKHTTFRQLYKESHFYKQKLCKILINNLLILKLFKLNFHNYNFSLNFFFESVKSNKSKKCFKVNLNYFGNRFILYKFKYHLPLAATKLKTKYTFSKFLFIKINPYNTKISKMLYSKIANFWNVKYSPSNFIKYIKNNKINNYTILYLRKNKVFNKGRYSRNRQYYRTGVYWCLYVNVIAVIGIYFWFYRFTMNFGYLWWILYIFIFSFLIPKTIKYRLYNPRLIYLDYLNSFIWSYNILNNILINCFKLIYSCNLTLSNFIQINWKKFWSFTKISYKYFQSI